MKFPYPPVPGRISVAMPSRGRPLGLIRAWQSLRHNAHSPWDLELLVAYDADDPDTGRVAGQFGAQLIEFSQRLYWDGNNTYFAALFAKSSGEWILPFGDDGEMMSMNWDRVVRRQEPGVLYLRGGIADHNVFPIVHRSVLEALTWDQCPSPHQDTWLTDVARDAGILRETALVAIEHRAIDDTRPHDRFRYQTERYYSSEMEALRKDDVEVLRERFKAEV